MPPRNEKRSAHPLREARKLAEGLLDQRVNAEVRFTRKDRALYATDGSNYRQIPLGVVIPRSVEAVEQILALCRTYGLPVLTRGGGTALAGQTCNHAVLIDFSKYLHHILEVNPDQKTARVQPGTILDHLRDLAQGRYNLTYGPDPATHNHCTFGGMIGNNSCGIHSVMAGRTADNVEELEILTYDGLRMRVGKTSEEELNRIIAQGGRKGEIYRRMKELRDKYAQEIRSRYPKIPRRVSGYNLDDLLPENGFDVAKALVGSEGTLVTILEATVRLVYSPPGRALLVLGYPDVYTAADHVPNIMEHHPVGLEGIDELLVVYMRRKGLHPEDVKLLPEGKGWLLVEFGGDNRDQAQQRAQEVMNWLNQQPDHPSMKLYVDPWEEHLVWQIRESGLGATAVVPGMPLTWPGWEDSAVAPEKMGDYMRDFRKLLDEHHLQASLYGHLGQGCLHCRISFDMFTREGVRNYYDFVDKASDLVVRYGGSLSGEHGDGQSRAMFLPKMFGPDLIKAFDEFKGIWDPNWKMNPGKVVHPNRIDQNLRLGPNYNPKQPATHFHFINDNGSFSLAALRCVGVGECRRTHDAFMCPSFLATREEEHTTRGRAHLLFEMLRGDFIRDGWNSREVFDSLDLCLACKGCKKECPINVDMATYKAEFLSHYYRRHARPRDSYSMGLVDTWARLGSLSPGLANALGQAPLISNAIKWIGGISQRRDLPRFAEIPFTVSFQRYLPRHPRGALVVLYPDPFNDYFFPQSLWAAVDALERWGFLVTLPPGRVVGLRPLIHYGWLAWAKRRLKYTIGLLRPFAREDVPIIHLEPSTAAVFRDELPQLLPNDRDGQRVTKNTLLLSEFADQRDLEVPHLEGKVIFHGHCHQKAVLNADAARHILHKMGLQVQEPQPGCCGMAGSFGFEARHYDVSMAIGEEHLLPEVRKAQPGTYIVADGFSCRMQILEGTGRVALHLAELLQQAFRMAGREVPVQAEEEAVPV